MPIVLALTAALGCGCMKSPELLYEERRNQELTRQVNELYDNIKGLPALQAEVEILRKKKARLLKLQARK